MVRTSQVTSAEEPDGGNLHVRIWRGAGLRKWLGLLHNRAESAAVSSPPPKPHRAPVWFKYAGIVVLALLVSQYLAGWLLLEWLHLDPRSAGPLTIARYGYYYGERADLRPRLWAASLAGLTFVCLCPLALLLPRRRCAAWRCALCDASRSRARRALGRARIILGRRGPTLPRCLPASRACALAAPPRAGKGTGVVIPNPSNWPDSVICVDIKRENWTITAGFRAASGQECYLFDPFADDRQHRALESLLLRRRESRAARE